MDLTCYQTAWNWLQKIRCGAAMAEIDPCSRIVLFEVYPLSSPPTSQTLSSNMSPEICMALEVNTDKAITGRLRLSTITPKTPHNVTKVINKLVDAQSILLVRDQHWLTTDCKIGSKHQGSPTADQLSRSQQLFYEIEAWLKSVYRSAIDVNHLQGYLDEFCFRHNTAFWTDQFEIFDHLLTGLLSTNDTSKGARP
jgi:hypothetical protein